MTKNLLVAATLFCAGIVSAQECTPTETLNEDFSTFTVATSNAFPQNCWNAIAGGMQGPWVYTAQAGEPSNKYAVYYTHTGGANVAGYIVSPELSTIDGNHELSFDTYKLGMNGQIPPGTITVQVGTLSNATDVSTFVAVGDPFSVGDVSTTFDNIVIAASETQKFVAFKFLSDATFSAAALDNVVWSLVPPVTPECEAAATINEDFNSFSQSFTAVNQNCWSANAAPPLFYVDGNDEATENYVAFYANNLANATGYLVSPKITTMDGAHELTFDAALLSPSSIISVQVGTLETPGDTESFMAFGEAISLSMSMTSVPAMVLPASETQKHIAFRFTATGSHDAASIDNIMWKESDTASIDDIAAKSFSIYPNPSTDRNITLNHNLQQEATVSVYTLTGSLVSKDTLSHSVHNLNTASLSAGMYIVKVESGDFTQAKKIILQ